MCAGDISSHQQKFIMEYWNDENVEKEVGQGPLKNPVFVQQNTTFF